MSGRSTAQQWLRRVARQGERAAADREPPSAPAGWVPAPPDFVGVGVQRGGTSWWFDEIAKHPDVHHAPDAPKEVHFFDAFSDRPLGAADIERYHRWFPRPSGGIAGEWTPSYVYEPWVVPLLARAAPAARLLVMLRDPVDRFRSSLLFTLRRGVPHSQAVLDAYHRGLYSSQIARLYAHAAPERILVLAYEEVRAAPDAAMRRTAEFIGLDPGKVPGAIVVERPRNREKRIAAQLPPELLAEVTVRYRADIEQLATLVPALDLGIWPTASAAV